MFQLRRSAALFVFAGLFAGGVLAGQASAEGKPCKADKFEFKKVEKACKEGGQTAVKKLMKGIVKKMKADGKEVKCKSCHNSLKEFDLTDNAVKDLKPYI